MSFQMDSLIENIAIATTTFYKPEQKVGQLRMKLARESVREATDLGYKIVVVDGGSSDEFLREIERYGAVVEAEEKGTMGTGRRHAISRAAELGKIVAWTEPEKNSYISQIKKTAIPVHEGRADLVVPTRPSLDSYPTSQQHAEKFGNQVWYELTGIRLDMWIGPRTWRSDLSHYFTQYDGIKAGFGDKWEAIFLPVMKMHHDGKKVIAVDIDYTHPQEQTNLEEGNMEFTGKRLIQLNNLLPALETYWKSLKSAK